jgi:hypothetical protein
VILVPGDRTRTCTPCGTFYLYEQQQGGSPLWLETQNVQPDSTGHYAVVLGSTTSQGLPASLFASGEAHWLGVQVQGQEEQPRVLLVSAPYALKAGDAETIGGLPPSAFVLTTPAAGSAAAAVSAGTPGKAPPPSKQVHVLPPIESVLTLTELAASPNHFLPAITFEMSRSLPGLTYRLQSWYYIC